MISESPPILEHPQVRMIRVKVNDLFVNDPMMLLNKCISLRHDVVELRTHDLPFFAHAGFCWQYVFLAIANLAAHVLRTLAPWHLS